MATKDSAWVVVNAQAAIFLGNRTKQFYMEPVGDGRWVIADSQKMADAGVKMTKKGHQ